VQTENQNVAVLGLTVPLCRTGGKLKILRVTWFSCGKLETRTRLKLV